MITLQKLNQTFVPETEATAASLNLLSSKIDDIIEAITTNLGVVATVIGDNKITSIGSGLEILNNSLKATGYTLPAASSNSLGGIKVGSGLSISSAGVLSVTSLSLSLISSDLKYFVKYDANDYSITGATIHQVEFTTVAGQEKATFSPEYGRTLVLLIPSDTDLFVLKDGGDTDITSDLTHIGLMVFTSKLYTAYYFVGTNVQDTYTVIKS